MNKKYIISLVLFIIFCFGIISIEKYFPRTSKEVHLHAGFQVYINNKMVNFSKFQYMKQEPCSVTTTQHTEDEQLEKAHLHDMVGNVVHVHRENATWGDLFKNIHYVLPSNDIITYINNKKKENLLEQPIHAYDSVIIIIGQHTEISSYLKNAVTRSYIKKIEERSEKCGAKN